MQVFLQILHLSFFIYHVDSIDHNSLLAYLFSFQNSRFFWFSIKKEMNYCCAARTWGLPEWWKEHAFLFVSWTWQFFLISDKPENVTLILEINKPSNIFLVGEKLSFICQSSAEPTPCTMSFTFPGYTGSKSVESKNCSARFEMVIQGCGPSTLTCQAVNEEGTGMNSLLLTVQGNIPCDPIIHLNDHRTVDLSRGWVFYP